MSLKKSTAWDKIGRRRRRAVAVQADMGLR